MQHCMSHLVLSIYLVLKVYKKNKTPDRLALGLFFLKFEYALIVVII
jgi:hypothetical protein